MVQSAPRHWFPQGLLTTSKGNHGIVWRFKSNSERRNTSGARPLQLIQRTFATTPLPVERATGIEPALFAWEAKVPPQHFARVAQFITYRYSPNVQLHFSQHHSQLRNDRRDSPKISPKFLRISATQTSVKTLVFSSFSSFRAEFLTGSDLLGKLMFCH